MHAKQLLEKLEAVSAANGGARVHVVSHSMGGLVMKFLLSQYPGAFERLVRAPFISCQSHALFKPAVSSIPGSHHIALNMHYPLPDFQVRLSSYHSIRSNLALTGDGAQSVDISMIFPHIIVLLLNQRCHNAVPSIICAVYWLQVQKWVAIACPFGGAPGFCMDALLTGAQFTTGGWSHELLAFELTQW